MRQRSIHSPSFLPELTKCKFCNNLLSDVSTRSINKQVCENCYNKKRVSKALKFAKECYKLWLPTKTPIYKFDLLHQTAIKFSILNKNTKMNKTEFKIARHRVYENWVRKNRNKKRKNDRIYWHIIVRRKFALFWDRIEFTKKCKWCTRPCSGVFCSEECHLKKNECNLKNAKRRYMRRDQHVFLPW